MTIDEHLKYRKEILYECRDEDGFISEPQFLYYCLPSLAEAKLLDSEDCTDCYFSTEENQVKINGYVINESGERLQLFLVNDESINLAASKDNLLVSQKGYYDKLFAKALKFVNKSIKSHLDDEVQDSHPIKALISYLSSPEGREAIDVIEIFLLSATSTFESRGETPQPKRIEFDDDTFKVSFQKDGKRCDKEVTIIKRLIDLNFLFTVLISQGNREALEIDFEKRFNYKIPCLRAANEENFESYLCVLPANILAELYKHDSTRLLEKNVRSFLQFKGVNLGIKDTIRREPEKFIAYNNGLTITAISREIEEENGQLYIKSLKDFQIVNGGQTTATIYFSRKEGLDISKIQIMAKINIAKFENDEALDELISNISTFSNAQNRVSKVDLRSRSPQLMKLKSLSDSVVAPSGKKWFFERAKGEFNTMIRKAPKQQDRINKEYPRDRRFSKEDLAKYYTAWGEQPFMVKKGGEKVFRFFIEEISGNEKNKKPIDINRDFFEEVIARIILFRNLEKIYGSGADSMGQIRSAVVPYSISILFAYTNGLKDFVFDLAKIWSSEGLEEDLKVFFIELMTMMNDLIKKYSQSDDFGEYSKKPELWESIKTCKEINLLVSKPNFKKIVNKYCISKEDYLKRLKKRVNSVQVNFESIYQMSEIYQNTTNLYRAIRMRLGSSLSKLEEIKLTRIISSIDKWEDIEPGLLQFEKELIHRVRINYPDLFDTVSGKEDVSYSKSLAFVVKCYNNCVDQGKDLRSEFNLLGDFATAKGAKFASVFGEMGRALKEGNAPTIKQLRGVWNYLQFEEKN